jgi:cullin 1
MSTDQAIRSYIQTHTTDYVDYAAPGNETAAKDLAIFIQSLLTNRELPSASLESVFSLCDKFAIVGFAKKLTRGFTHNLSDTSSFLSVIPNKVHCALYTMVLKIINTARVETDEVMLRTTVYNYITNHIEHFYNDMIIPSLHDKRGVYLLVEFARHWENHKYFVEWIRRIFFRIQPERKRDCPPIPTPSITSLGHTYFKMRLFDTYKSQIIDTIQTQIMLDRIGEPAETQAIKSTIELFCVMGIIDVTNDFIDSNDVKHKTRDMDPSKNVTYLNDFEEIYMAETTAYYRQLSDKWINECNVPEYLINVEKAFSNEEDILSRYCHHSTAPKLLESMVEIILIRYQNALLTNERTGLKQLLINHCEDDIGRMYRLFSKFPEGLTPMAEIMRLHITELGTDIIEQRKQRLAGKDGRKYDACDTVLIQQFIALFNKYTLMVNDYTDNCPLFQKMIQDSFRVTLNMSAREDDMHPNSELMAVFVDMILRGKLGEEKLSEETITQTLKDVHRLFAHLHDKDHFQEFYRNLLAKRLLQNKSHSSDAERYMISLLKSSDGATYTQRFEAMITNFANPDMAVNPAEFKTELVEWTRKRQREEESEGHVPRETIDFDVKVLCGGSWPTMYDTSRVVFPTYLRELYEFYTYHFNQKHGGTRKLTYGHTEGSLTIRANIGDKSGSPSDKSGSPSDKSGSWYEFVMMPVQSVLLLQFNEREELTPAELAKLCGLSEEDTMKLLHPLVHAPVCKILTKKNRIVTKPTPGTPPVPERFMASDVLVVDKKFKNPLRRINVPFIPLKEKQVVNSSESDAQRKHVINATVVRVMKARKTMRYDALIAEVQRQIRTFNADPRMMKLCIDNLIDTGYLERSEEDRMELNYLA